MIEPAAVPILSKHFLAILEDPTVRLRWETGDTQAHKEASEALVRALREAEMRGS